MINVLKNAWKKWKKGGGDGWFPIDFIRIRLFRSTEENSISRKIPLSKQTAKILSLAHRPAEGEKTNNYYEKEGGEKTHLVNRQPSWTN